MKDLLPVLIPILTLVLGAGLTHFFERVRWKRQVQREDANRMWQARSDLYVRLLELTLYKGDDEKLDAQLSKDLADVAGRVYAFASDDVVQTFDTIHHASMMPNTSEDEKDFRTERIGMRINDLVGIVRDEIQGIKHKRPRFERFLRKIMSERRYQKRLMHKSIRKNISDRRPS